MNEANMAKLIERALEVEREESLEEVIARLANLSPYQYEEVRKKEAEKRNIRVGELDAFVESRRKQLNPPEKDALERLSPSVEPYSEPVELNEILNELVSLVREYIVCSEETAVATALWIVFSWTFDCFDILPIALITAPEKRCGKSRLLDLMGFLVRRKVQVSGISSAALYRTIELFQPTFLVDECDTFMKDNPEIAGVINSGHTRGSAHVMRVNPDTLLPEAYSTFAPKILCGIGKPTDTILDRSIVLVLKRKLTNEKVKRLSYKSEERFNVLASKLLRFSHDAEEALSNSLPEPVDGLNDRAQDNWEPLFAIADYAGGDWPLIARKTALALSGGEQDSVSLSIELLKDIRQIFNDVKKDKIPTADLLYRLTDMELRPWPTYNHGRGIVANQLAKRLGEFNIRPRDIKFEGRTLKGYLLADLQDTFDRYLSSTLSGEAEKSATPQPSAKSTEKTTGCPESDEYFPDMIEENEMTAIPLKNKRSCGVAANEEMDVDEDDPLGF